MGEGLVGFGHLVGLLPLADGAAGLVGRIHQFAGQLLGHAAAVAGAREVDQPAQCHGGAPLLTHFHGHLIGGATDPAGPHLHQGGGVADGRFEQIERVGAGALVDQAEGIGEDALGRGLLAVLHQPGHDHRGQTAVELGVRQDRSFLGGVAAGHGTEEGEGGSRRGSAGAAGRVGDFSPSASWRRTWSGTGAGP